MSKTKPNSLPAKLLTYRAKTLPITLALVSIGWLTNLVPGWNPKLGTLDFSSQANAQSLSNDQISRYAAAILEIEPIRIKSFAKVKKITQGNMPENVCDQQNIRDDVRAICSSYFLQSAQIIQRHRLSLEEFNRITQLANQDSYTEQQIQKALVCHQRGISAQSCF
jgi:hypothetical protein